MKKTRVVLLALMMVFAFATTAMAADEPVSYTHLCFTSCFASAFAAATSSDILAAIAKPHPLLTSKKPPVSRRFHLFAPLPMLAL